MNAPYLKCRRSCAPSANCWAKSAASAPTVTIKGVGMASTSKTMRLSDDVIKLIEAEPGSTFTEKFENLVYRAFDEIPKHEERLESLKRCIKSETWRLERIRSTAAKLENQSNNLQFSLTNMTQQLKRAVSGLEDLYKDCKTD